MTLSHEQQLHDRLTRGETLMAEEQAQLEAWYREQDRAESLLLDQSTVPADVDILRAQLTTAINQLALVSNHINDVMAANEALRRDIARLQAQLVPQMHGQAA